jgi:hypothetical protein
MDNFDLKDYLGNNVLLEQDGKLDDILVQRDDILKTISITDERELWDFLSKNSPIGFEKKLFIMDNFEQIRKGEITTMPYNWLKTTYPDISKLTDKKFFGGLKNEKELEKATVDIHNKFFDFIKDKTGNELSIGRSEYDFGGAVETASDLIQGAADASGESPSGIKQAYIRAKDSLINFRERSKDLFEKISGEELGDGPTSDEGGNSIIDTIIISILGVTGYFVFRFWRIAKRTVMPWIDSQNAAMRARKDADLTAKFLRTEQDSYENLRNSKWYRGWFQKFENFWKPWYKRKQQRDANEEVVKEEPLLFESLQTGDNKLDKLYSSLFKNVGILSLTKPTIGLNFIADYFDGEVADNILPAGKNLLEKLPDSKRAKQINNIVKAIDSVEFEPIPEDLVNEEKQSEDLTGLASTIIDSGKDTLENGFGVEDTSSFSEYISKIREFFNTFIDEIDEETQEIIQKLAPSDWVVTLVKWAVSIYTIIIAAVLYAIRVAHKMTPQRGTAGYEKARADANKELLSQWKRFWKFFDINRPRTPFDESRKTSLTGIILEEEGEFTKLSPNAFLNLLPYFYTDPAAMMNFTEDLKPLAKKYVLNLVSFKPKAESIKSFFSGLKDAAVKLEGEVKDKSKVKEFISTL